MSDHHYQFHPVMYDRQRPVGSYWESSAPKPDINWAPLEDDVHCDVAIIGAGYTGLSAAYHLLAHSDVDVRILEAGLPGWGASGRNGGHCCFGGAGLDPVEIAQQFGEDIARQNIAVQRQSIELVEDLSTTHKMDIDRHGSGELCIAHRPGEMTTLRKEAEVWRQLGGFYCRLMSTNELEEEAYSGPAVSGGMLFPFGFGIHPLKYAYALATLAASAGAKIHAHSAVESWSREGGKHRLHTKTGSVLAKKILIATNGFTADSLHPAIDGCLLPAISQIIATRELSETELKAHNWRTKNPLYDTRPMFSYLQMTPHNRLVIGTGGGMSGSERSALFWRRILVRRIGEMFPQWSKVDITHSWRGLICLSKDRLTHVGEVVDDPGVFYSLAYHGNGVAMATWSGRAVAGLITGRSNNPIPATMRQPLGRFPVATLRKWHIYLRYSRQMLKHWFNL